MVKVERVRSNPQRGNAKVQLVDIWVTQLWSCRAFSGKVESQLRKKVNICKWWNILLFLKLTMLKLLQTAGNVELFTSTTELPSPLPKPAPSIWNAGAAGGDFSQLGVKVLAPVFALVNIIWVAGVLRFLKDPKHHVWLLTIQIWQRKHERRRNFSNICDLKPAQFLSLPALNVNLLEEAQKGNDSPPRGLGEKWRLEETVVWGISPPRKLPKTEFGDHLSSI